MRTTWKCAIGARAVAVVLTVFVGLSLPSTKALAEPPPELTVLAADLLRDLDDHLAAVPEEEIPQAVREAALAILQREDAFSWPFTPLVPRISGGMEVLAAAGLAGRARDMAAAESAQVQKALDAAVVDRDMAAAATILSGIGGGAAPNSEALGAVLTVVFQGIMDPRTWPQIETRHEYASQSGPQRILLEWDREARSFRLRISNLLPEKAPGTWFEVEGPVGVKLAENPVWFEATVLTPRRTFRHGVDGEAGVSQVAEAEAPAAAPGGLEDEIARLKEEIMFASCGFGTIWKNTQTGELVCKTGGRPPDGPFVFHDTYEPEADAEAKNARLREELAALEDRLAGQDQTSPPADGPDCAARASTFATSGPVVSADPQGIIRVRCGNILNFGSHVEVDVAIPADAFVTSDPNYSGNGSYHKLMVRSAARLLRGDGVMARGGIDSFDLADPTGRVDLGVLPPGFYRLSVVAWKEELAQAWLLVTVDQRPGALRLAGDRPPSAGRPFDVIFDAPKIARAATQAELPRYELEVIPIGQDGRGHKQSRGVEREFDAAPGQSIRIDPWMVRPGANLVRLLLNSGDGRYVLDTLALELGGQEDLRAPVHFALNGETDPENSGLTVFEGKRQTVEFGLGGPLALVGGKATFRVYRLEAPLLSGSGGRQRVFVLPAGAHPGEIVDERPPQALKDLQVWDVATPLPPGHYAAGVELSASTQMFMLHFDVRPAEGRARLVLDGGNRFAVGQDVVARIAHADAQGDLALRLYRLGGYVPGCAIERERLVTPNDTPIEQLRNESGGLSGYRIGSLDPGLYLLRMVHSTRTGEAIVDEDGFEVVSGQAGTPEDRAEARRNPWPPFGGSLDGVDCAAVAIEEEEIKLRLVRLESGEFQAVEGPAEYGKPYYLEGRLENEARQRSYLAEVGAPDGTPEDVRLYKVEGQPNVLRSEIIYFLWDASAEEAPDADR
ncbi:hypothetical protein [Pelagibius marinus]|uniref:hypothetical protein n=1 Tax=Pelagibius marinus TaxID=2762760 RepID=UPI0018730577|nr:hypothetical protein [Pelagibius marinus]